MSIIKLNNRSVKNVTSFGSISSLGNFIHIATQTASSSASISFTTGIDSTYKEYIFYYIDMHPSATDVDGLTFQGDTGTNTNYNQQITSTYFRSSHDESGSNAEVAYQASQDQANGTGFQNISQNVGTDNDQSCSGFLHLFNPSSSVFVKHFIARNNNAHQSDKTRDVLCSGYFNTTTAITRIQFKFSSGNIDSGQILLFGLN